ncbi:MAG: prepilin-type N-terminal cleavage/methylation domain-containing protein [Gammaproteobacteria bacterium]|jgi:general secretion pathway protein J|nr:prepilin-type N-terminal cleavage/methylation domain-containing protein [Gammaproteobacteria bacterium]
MRRETGFTLLELLVSMTILSIMMTLLFNGLQLGIRTWDAVSDASQRTQDVYFAQQFIRRHLEEAQPVTPDPINTQQQLVFSGDANSLRFVGLMPSYLGHGGLHLINFEIMDQDKGKQLILRYELFQNNGWENYSGEESSSIVLLENLEDAEFAFTSAGSSRQAGNWKKRWDGSKEFPRLIRLRIRSTGSAPDTWNELLVAPKLNASQKIPSIQTGVRT